MNSKESEENTKIDDDNLEEKGNVNQPINNSSSYILFIILYRNTFKFSTNKHWY